MTPQATRSRKTDRIAPTTPLGTPVADLATSLACDLKFPIDWLTWPPDMFAFTSAVLRQTGCYRFVLDSRFQQDVTWQARIERCAERWLRYVDSIVSAWFDQRKPVRYQNELEPFCEAIRDLERLATRVTMEDLRALHTDDARCLAKALITVHAVADVACTGFGMLGRFARRQRLDRESDGGAAHAIFLANFLLTAYGSLSTLCKHHGIVLPKMRTPQSGLSLRSLSHHVTYHTSEVEVMWRTMPWASVEENTINILLVPWPDSLDYRAFCAVPETFAAVRFFKYEPPKTFPERRLKDLVRLILRLNQEVGRIHLVVLPELALTREQYEFLLMRLGKIHERSEHPLPHVPMVITGVHCCDEAHQRNGDAARVDLNEVHLAAYFSGRWYELSQRKHHRWKLDRNQVRQYQLEGRLSTARSWFEGIPVSQRRLTFLVPNGWLTLCPLICEDLAQLDPVGDVIRGVGPTLLTALLMDGPQLRERWAARYASVFADDPGTAVLTLTSKGMVKRSRRVDARPDGEAKDNRAAKSTAAYTVGLWKDQPSGWHSLDLPDAEQALLLTISSSFAEEYTADGRTDHAVASVFRFEGVHGFQIDSEDEDQWSAEFAVPDPPPDSTHQPRKGPDTGREFFGDWSDIRELTATMFAVDSLLQLPPEHADHVVDLLLGRIRSRKRASHRIGKIAFLIASAFREPAAAGVEALPRKRWPSAELRETAEVLRAWFKQPMPANDVGYIRYWESVVDEAENRLTLTSETVVAEPGRQTNGRRRHRTASQRVERAAALMVLHGIHTRVESLRAALQRPISASDGSPNVRQRAAALMGRIEDLLGRHA